MENRDIVHLSLLGELNSIKFHCEEASILAGNYAYEEAQYCIKELIKVSKLVEIDINLLIKEKKVHEGRKS